jgi:hypothetical protein
MKRHAAREVVVLMTVLAANAVAQSVPKPAAQEPSGFTSYVEFGGTANSEGQIYEVITSVGYDFNPHFGADAGVPIYFVRPSSSTGATSTNGLGDPFLDLRVRFLNPAVNFASVLSGFAPVGDSKKGLSTGRATFDWTNHFNHSFSDLKPFVNVGIANTIVNSTLFVRPYTTLGFNTHFEGGATYAVWKFFRLGAAGYDIVPSGQQTVFSQVAHGASAKHGRVFEDSQQTTGGADIAKDDGFSTWVDANPWRGVDLTLGFTRSAHYDLNSVSFALGFNLMQLYGRHVQ